MDQTNGMESLKALALTSGWLNSNESVTNATPATTSDSSTLTISTLSTTGYCYQTYPSWSYPVYAILEKFTSQIEIAVDFE